MEGNAKHKQNPNQVKCDGIFDFYQATNKFVMRLHSDIKQESQKNTRNSFKLYNGEYLRGEHFYEQYCIKGKYNINRTYLERNFLAIF